MGYGYEAKQGMGAVKLGAVKLGLAPNHEMVTLPRGGEVVRFIPCFSSLPAPAV